MFLGLVEMNFGLVNASHSLLEWQAAKLTFFAPKPAYSDYKKQRWPSGESTPTHAH